MTEILKIGRLLRTDKDGFIVNESSADKITAPWKDATEEIIEIYRAHLGDILHSIYVRGTVSRGEAIPGIADIDTFAVIRKKPEELDLSWRHGAIEALEKKYTFATGVEIDFIFYDDAVNDIIEKFFIKTQSACVYGKDLTQEIQPFKADKQTAAYLHGNLGKIFENCKNGLSKNPSGDEVKKWCRWVMKRILRSGFVLVMDEEKAFTRDLHPAYELFSKHYPDQERNMREALELAINPTDDKEKLVAFLDGFGMWLKRELDKKFNL